MGSALRAMSPATKTRVFGTLYALSILLAIFPPFYLWAGGHAGTVLGLPFSVGYMIFDALLITAIVAALYYVEDARGELD